jgi:rfaE bifunctional protein nucleotidyltransferase chain/domain
MCEIRKQYKSRGMNVVFSNGCFDILHKGHVEYLAKARDCGDVLVIGLNTDGSVKRIKGPSRPVHDNDTRAIILAALQFVDHIVFFDENTPAKLIETLVPDVLVKGADYKIENIVGSSVVIANGGEVKTIALTEGHSTTNIINKLLHE